MTSCASIQEGPWRTWSSRGRPGGFVRAADAGQPPFPSLLERAKLEGFVRCASQQKNPPLGEGTAYPSRAPTHTGSVQLVFRRSLSPPGGRSTAGGWLAVEAG